MAQGWNSLSSLTESEHSAIRADFRAKERDAPARLLRIIRRPARGPATLQQQRQQQ